MKVVSVNSNSFNRYFCAYPKSTSENRKTKDNTLVMSALAVGVGLISYGFYCKFHKAKANNVITETLSNQFNKNKLVERCRSVKLENYVASPENMENGVFQLDLHSHSTHSDGWGYVKNILDEVAQYSQVVYQKTKKNFVFALTDHDRVSGVQEALDYIKTNKEKFKHVDFVPGVELSFAFNSGGNVKYGEVLAYFINPQSATIKKLVNNLNINRNNMINNCIKDLGQGFSRKNMENYFINEDGETFAYALHYRLRNYAQIQNRINLISQERHENSQKLYKELMDKYVFSSPQRISKSDVSPEGFDKFLKSVSYKTETQVIDEKIDKICHKYFPKIKNGHIVSDTENSFEKIVDALKQENGVCLSFAHPYFTASQMQDYKKEFSYLINYAKPLLIMSENYHQSYPNNIPQNKIEEINKFLLGQSLIPMGGRDNHSNSFFTNISK